MANYPDSTKASLEQRLAARARESWPQIASQQALDTACGLYLGDPTAWT